MIADECLDRMRVAGPGRPADRNERAPDPPDQPLRVLVADDEHLAAMQLESSLSELGYRVVGPVSDGEAAVELARRTLPHLALLDVRMPRMDGLSTARALATTLDIPSVMVSAYSDTGYVEAAAALGIVGYLVKPVDEGQLRAAIELAWRRAATRSAERLAARSLRKRLEERSLIEQAARLMARSDGLSEQEASRRMAEFARTTRQRVAAVALAVVLKRLRIEP